MNMFFDGFTNLFASIGPFFILLGLLIFIHELGHFLVAKYYGVRVETFSLGFGRKILSYKRGDTVYCISAIPLGGYVKMFGDDPTADVPASERPYSFLHKPLGQRAAVVLAGPLMNLFFAIVLFTMIAGLGEEVPGPRIGDVSETSAAFKAGFHSGDKILNINGEATPTWIEIKKRIEASPEKILSFTVERTGEPQPLKIEASTTRGENENIFSSDRQVGQIEGLGAESRSTLIGVKKRDTPAGRAGIKSLDLIVEIEGRPVSYWRELQPSILQSLAEKPQSLSLKVRDITLPEKPENTRTVNVEVPAGWDEKTDIMDYLGMESAELYIFQIKKKSPAESVGVAPGDRVVRIDNEDVNTWSDVLNHVKNFDPAKKSLQFTILRDGEEKTFEVTPAMTEMMTMKGQEERRYTIGIVSGFLPAGPEPVFHRAHDVGGMFVQGAKDTATWTEFVVMSLVRLVQGEVSAKNVGGVITIGRVASHSFEAGLSSFLKTMAIISINLFLLNLLPVPVLDGGHLLFYSIEAIKGAPLSMRKMELAQQIGLMLLMILMVFAFYNDITNLLNRW